MPRSILISAVLFVLRQRFLRRSGRICGMRPGLARGSKRVGLSETEEGREAARLVSGRKGGRAVPVDLHSCGFSSLAVVERYAGRCPRGYGQQQPDRTVPAGARLTARTRYPARADWNAARSGEHAYLIVSAQRRTLSCRNLAAVPAHTGQHRRRTFRQAAIPPTLHLSDRQNGFRVSADPAAPLRREWVARDEGHGHCAEGRLGAHRALDERTRVCD